MPKLSTFRITKRTVDSLKSNRDAIYFDADLRGFAVRTKPSGAKTYLVQYEASGRTRRVSIGQHGAVSPAEARTEAAVLLGKVKSGGDPAEDHLRERRAMTVSQLCESYLAAADKRLVLGKRGLAKKNTTLYTDRGRILRHILPLLGNRKVRDITTPDIIRFMRDVAAGKTAADVRTKSRGRAIVKGGSGTAARTVGLLGGILSYAVSEGIIQVNPARGVKRPADIRRNVRLTAQEYALLGRALDQADKNGEIWQVTGAIRLLALTGCRRGEIEALKWSEVDVAGHCLRLTDTKSGASIRPIGQAAITLLKQLPRSISEFVFPSTRSKGYSKSLPKAWARIISAMPKDSELRDLTPHGLRHAYASTAHDLGLTEITIGVLLGHSINSTTGRYIHHLDAVLIGAADLVASSIAGFLQGNSTNSIREVRTP